MRSANVKSISEATLQSSHETHLNHFYYYSRSICWPILQFQFSSVLFFDRSNSTNISQTDINKWKSRRHHAIYRMKHLLSGLTKNCAGTFKNGINLSNGQNVSFLFVHAATMFFSLLFFKCELRLQIFFSVFQRINHNHSFFSVCRESQKIHCH